MSLPVSANQVFWGVNTVFQVSGATWAAVSDIELGWGNTIHRELATGTDIPYYGTGGFEGRARITALGAWDARFEQVVAPASNGQVPTFGMTWQEINPLGSGASGSTATWTVSGKFSNYTKVGQNDQVVRYRMEASVVTRPTVVRS